MVYYSDDEIVIRTMTPEDAPVITEEEIAQGWHASVEKYEMRLKDQAEGRAVSLVAVYQGNVAGYIPDGSGVWYRDEVCPQYTDCCNDDDLVLYLSKELR